jgi:hypothetical protein
MAGLAESVSERLVYKMYASSEIDSGTEPLIATAPGSTGGQVLRHVSHNLSLNKDSYRPNEKRQDTQQTMGKHGSRTVPGTINGFLSPGTHQDLFAAVFRSEWADTVELDETELTSVALDATAKTATFAGGDPVALGLRVGMQFQFDGLATSANNDKTFTILGFSGSNNRIVSIYPAPTTQAADTSFTLVSSKFLTNPATQAERTNYKFAFEVYNPDIDLARFYTEARIGGFDLSIGVNANVGLNFSLLGRNRKVLTGADAPFFTAPVAETSTDIPTAMQGLLMLGGSVIGVVTGANIKVDLGPEAAKAINPDGLVAGILLGDFAAFDDETELSFLAFLPSSNAPDAPATTFYMPRIKINSNNESEVNKAKAIQCQFEAARYFGNAPGVPSTTLMICDSAVV